MPARWCCIPTARSKAATIRARTAARRVCDVLVFTRRADGVPDSPAGPCIARSSVSVAVIRTPDQRHSETARSRAGPFWPFCRLPADLLPMRSDRDRAECAARLGVEYRSFWPRWRGSADAGLAAAVDAIGLLMAWGGAYRIRSDWQPTRRYTCSRVGRQHQPVAGGLRSIAVDPACWSDDRASQLELPPAFLPPVPADPSRSMDAGAAGAAGLHFTFGMLSAGISR